MSHYLMKFKGQYRLLPELDIETNDIPREVTGEVADGYDDIYIACSHGNKIFSYGHIDNKKDVWLMAYIPSIGRGNNIVKALDKQGIEYIDYIKTDAEIEFKFRAKDIEPVAELMKAKTAGANISPFSKRNLPKSDVEIPTEEIARYKEITSIVPKGDLLIISRVTSTFLDKTVQKKSKKVDKKFDVKSDMKRMKMGRQVKTYIYVKGFWEEYLDYLQKELKEYNKR